MTTADVKKKSVINICDYLMDVLSEEFNDLLMWILVTNLDISYER